MRATSDWEYAITTKLVILLIYLGSLMFVGWLASRRVKDTRDYFAAGKGIGFWSAAFSARATGESAWLLLGLTGMGAAVGLKAMWVVAGEVLGVGLAWMLMAKRFKRLTDQYDAITVPEYLEERFGDKSHLLRCVAALTLVVFVTIYVGAQVDATGKAFESFLGWNYYTGALVGYFVVLVYIITGGFLAVVWSDVIQGVLMFVGLTVLPLWALVHAGGLAPIEDSLQQIDPSLLSFSGAEGWTLATILGVIAFFGIGFGFLGSPQIFVRYLALRSEREVGRGATVAIVWTVLADSGAVLTGLFGRALLTGPDDDLNAVLGQSGQEVLPLLVEHLFPLVIVGIFVAVVLSAIMSTIDSLLVVASSAVVRDWYQKTRRPDLADDALTGLARKATFALATIALVIALIVAVLSPDRTVFWFVIFGWSGIACTFCPTIILSLFWSGFTRAGALSAMITGFVCVPLFKFGIYRIPGWGEQLAPLEEMVPAFLLSFLVGFVVSVARPESAERRDAVRRELDSAK